MWMWPSILTASGRLSPQEKLRRPAVPKLAVPGFICSNTGVITRFLFSRCRVWCRWPLTSCLCYRWRELPDVGLVLVQMNQGLWGLMPEPATASTKSARAARNPSATDERRGVSGGRAESKLPGQERGDAETATLHEGNTTSALFSAWPPLSSVVERYSHHVFSRRKRKVICLADSGVLEAYRLGPARGEARKIQSRKIDLHANGATATCMCLLPETPACVKAALDRLLAVRKSSETAPDGNAADNEDGCAEENYRDRRGGVAGRKKGSENEVEKCDRVVAIGTSHGGVLLVETVGDGTVSRESERRLQVCLLRSLLFPGRNGRAMKRKLQF